MTTDERLPKSLIQILPCSFCKGMNPHLPVLVEPSNWLYICTPLELDAWQIERKCRVKTVTFERGFI